MMDHLHPDELAAIALDGEAVRDDAVDDEHLDRCARCQREVSVLREVSGRARAAALDETPPAPPDEIWDRVVAELTAAGDIPPTRLEPRRRPIWQQQWAVAAGLIAVVVLAAALLLQLPSDDGQVVARATLAPLAEVDEASAALSANDAQRTLRVDIGSLPDIDGYYELWLLTPDGDGLVSLGPVDGTGRHDIPTAVDVDVFSVVDVSRERSDGDPSHSGDSVLRGPLQPEA